MICEIICVAGFLCMLHLDIVHISSAYVHVICILSEHMCIMCILSAVVLDIFLPNRQCQCHPYIIFSTLYIILSWRIYKARHAHKRLYTVLPKYSKIQVLPGITSCRLVKDNKQAIELNSLLINNMPEDGYGWN